MNKKELLQYYFKNDRWRLNICLAPGMDCQESAIRSHSIQNSKILDLLSVEGHVKGFNRRFDKENGPQIIFEKIGRRNATTFAGFCARHDSMIFELIDKNDFDQNNQEHLLLLFYRTVAKEVHSTMQSASKIQSTYLKRIELGIDNGNEPEAVGNLALSHMIMAYEAFNYKERLEKIMIAKDYGKVRHKIIDLTTDEPTIAVNSFITLDPRPDADDRVQMALNIFPVGARDSFAVFSCFDEDFEYVKISMDRIFSSAGYCQKYFLSKMILSNCQNFVLSPSYCDKWSNEKELAIRNYFIETLTDESPMENENLYVF